MEKKTHKQEQKEKIKELELKIEELELKIEELELKIEELELKIEELELKEEKEVLEKKINKLEQKKKELELKIEALGKKIKKTEPNYEFLSQIMESLEEDKGFLEKMDSSEKGQYKNIKKIDLRVGIAVVDDQLKNPVNNSTFFMINDVLLTGFEHNIKPFLNKEITVSFFPIVIENEGDKSKDGIHKSED